MKIFVFGIGGTGARVVRSLTMLLASGAQVPPNITFVPILLDMDMQNGDTERTLRAIELYRAIRKEAYLDTASSQDAERRTFFATPLQPLGTLQPDNAQTKIGETVLPKLTEHEGTFEEFLEVSSLEEPDREFLKLLYDNSSKPTRAELKLNLAMGFKGNPNIGSVVFNAFEDSDVYKYFTSAFNDARDRIFIISSIFGGTGSSGFPQLVKLLQHQDQRDPIRRARKGAVTVMPYFALEENAQSAIDQDRFLSKTKAALSYYHSQLGLDALYYIGDTPGSKSYPNVEGGKEQVNNAHVVEMLAAGAILDFAHKKDEEFDSGKRFHEFAIKRKDSTLDLPHFYETTHARLLEPLLHFAYATKLFLDFIPNHLDEAFAKKKGLNLVETLHTGSYYPALKNFMAHHFRPRLQEMAANDRSFHPFDLDAEFNAMVRAKRIETKLLSMDKGISNGFLKNKMGAAEDQLATKITHPERRFMQVLIQVAQQCREKLGSLNRQLSDAG